MDIETHLICGSQVKGYKDGKRGVALFSEPTGIIVDSDGDLVVRDTRNCAIRKIDKNGTVSTLSGVVGADLRMESHLDQCSNALLGSFQTDREVSLFLMSEIVRFEW